MNDARLSPIAVLGICVWLGLPANAASVRTQSISLRAGWNAVFLEVQPVASNPSAVFGSLPVETVACYFPARRDARFLQSPGDAPWREEGWAVWHEPSRPEAFLSNLHAIEAPRALLVRASTDFTWTVTGEALATRLDWHPNTCTLTGLPVDPTSPPTFTRFFEGSGAHRRMRVYRLEGPNWKVVRDPNTEKPRRGEAYWIETEGSSSYQGPLRVGIPASGTLEFDRVGSARDLEFVNDSLSVPLQIRAEVVSGADSLPLRWLRSTPDSLAPNRVPLSGAVELPLLPAGRRTVLRIEPDRLAMRAERGAALLRITDGRGTEHWLPIQARRDPGIAVSASN